MVVRYHFRKLRSTSDFGVPPERSSFARSLAAELQSFKTSQEFKRRSGGQHEISKKNSDPDGASGIGSCAVDGRLGSRTTGHGSHLPLHPPSTPSAAKNGGRPHPPPLYS